MAQADRANRPSLGHLLLLITCCAVCFALTRRFLDTPEREVSLGGLLIFSLLTMVVGICWTGMVVVVYRKLRSSQVPIEPGVWLMFCIGIVEATDILSHLLPDHFVIHKASLPMAVSCISFVLPMLSRRLPPIWKLLFALLVLANAIPLVAVLLVAFDALPQNNSMVRLCQTVQPYVVLAAVTITSMLDARAGRTHGWSHWLGIASLLIWVFLP